MYHIKQQNSHDSNKRLQPTPLTYIVTTKCSTNMYHSWSKTNHNNNLLQPTTTVMFHHITHTSMHNMLSNRTTTTTDCTRHKNNALPTCIIRYQRPHHCNHWLQPATTIIHVWKQASPTSPLSSERLEPECSCAHTTGVQVFSGGEGLRPGTPSHMHTWRQWPTKLPSWTLDIVRASTQRLWLHIPI